jgi:hypothetical protein
MNAAEEEAIVDRFEYQMLPWLPQDDGTGTVAVLNALGAEGWDAVGLAPRAVSVPMPGMGADAVPEMIVLLKRRRTD